MYSKINKHSGLRVNSPAVLVKLAHWRCLLALPLLLAPLHSTLAAIPSAEGVNEMRPLVINN